MRLAGRASNEASLADALGFAAVLRARDERLQLVHVAGFDPVASILALAVLAAAQQTVGQAWTLIDLGARERDVAAVEREAFAASGLERLDRLAHRIIGHVHRRSLGLAIARIAVTGIAVTRIAITIARLAVRRLLPERVQQRVGLHAAREREREHEHHGRRRFHA